MTRIYNVCIDVDTPPIEEKISKPAGRWRNKFRALIDGYTNVPVRAGEVYSSTKFHPTKEIAEEKGRLAVALCPTGEYLGAFPEGQDAP